MLSKKNTWLFLFTIDAGLNIFAEGIQNIPLIYITKPLLMIFLGLHFYFNKAIQVLGVSNFFSWA